MAIILVGAGLLYAVQVEGLSLFEPARDFSIVVYLMNLAFYIWIRTGSRFKLTTQIACIVFVLAVQTLLVQLVRFDEFAGDGRILFRWRFRPTPEERLAKFLSEQNPSLGSVNLTATREADSPAFRGADRTGRYHVSNLELDWNQHPPRELWRRPVGRGWSAFAVVGEYCFTQEQRGSFEAVVCYDLVTGHEVWQHLNETRFHEVTSGTGPRATPAIHQGRVYTFGATGILNCLDGERGRVIWSRDFTKETPPLFGHSCSPLIHNNHVFITPSRKSGSIVALDADSGEIAWTRGSRKAGYSSPQLFQTKTEDQIVIFDAAGLHGYEAETGRWRWTFLSGDNSDEEVNVSQPVILPFDETPSSSDLPANRLLISAGYGRGSTLINVSRTDSGEWKTKAIWQTKSLKSKFSDVIVHDGHAFGLDEGILTCISIDDGTRRWKNGRYGYGQLILVNETLLIQTESGQIALVPADPRQYQELSSLEALHDRTWNQPVLAGRYLLVRNDREAVCFELPVMGDGNALP